MPAYKDHVTGTWFVKFYSKDWRGENRQVKKRGFATKREALEYERNYKIRQECNLDMTFENFFTLYSEDMQQRLKRNTWLTKEHIVRTKILPYFKDMKMSEISPSDVLKWQNEMIAYRDEKGNGYTETYRKTMHNQLSCIFNHACRYYNLRSNPARKAGCMGKEESKEMLFWTKEEYKKFSEAVMDKDISFYSELAGTDSAMGRIGREIEQRESGITDTERRINEAKKRIEKVRETNERFSRLTARRTGTGVDGSSRRPADGNRGQGQDDSKTENTSERIARLKREAEQREQRRERTSLKERLEASKAAAADREREREQSKRANRGHSR